uniref:Uncharacterized protein n=1 Tax=Anguilla anguilla TaxID=7936 RepID=A0A0E9S019_ANGAN
MHLAAWLCDPCVRYAGRIFFCWVWSLTNVRSCSTWTKCTSSWTR